MTAGKPWADRYRLLRFGRGGFADKSDPAASRLSCAGSSAGKKEAYPRLGQVPRSPGCAIPVFPLILTFRCSGPSASFPCPSSGGSR